MKKQIVLIAAALLLCMTACKKETITPMENHQPEVTLVKSTADLIGTEWTLTLDLSDSIYVYDGGCGWTDSIMSQYLQFEFGLNFDSTYAHISFPDNVTVLSLGEVDGEYSMEEIESMNFAYTYDPATHTGSLTANTLDDNGNPDTFQIPFTYDTTTDAIIINMAFAYAENEDETISFQLVFHRNV